VTDSQTDGQTCYSNSGDVRQKYVNRCRGQTTMSNIFRSSQLLLLTIGHFPVKLHQCRGQTTMSNIFRSSQLLLLTIGHIPVKLHQYLISCLLRLTQTDKHIDTDRQSDRLTDTTKNNRPIPACSAYMEYSRLYSYTCSTKR